MLYLKINISEFRLILLDHITYVILVKTKASFIAPWLTESYRFAWLQGLNVKLCFTYVLHPFHFSSFLDDESMYTLFAFWKRVSRCEQFHLAQASYSTEGWKWCSYIITGRRERNGICCLAIIAIVTQYNKRDMMSARFILR